MKTRIIMKSGRQFNLYLPKFIECYFCDNENIFVTYVIKILQKSGVDYIIFGYCL